MSAALDIKDLTVEYPDGTRALSRVSLCVSPDENVALIGANGAGKTTLLLASVGVVDAVEGSVSSGGVALSKKTKKELRRRVGLVFQNPDDQLFMPDILGDVSFGPLNLGLNPREAEKRAMSIMESLGIAHLAKRSPMRLSGGEKRVAAIAAVLAMEPDIVLFDEPTAFLDPRARRALIVLLKKLPHAKLFATHDLPFAAELCGRVAILRDGGLFAEGGAELLYDAGLMDAGGIEAIPR